MAKHLGTEPYKGTRDFYPEDMAIQRYIFDTWAKAAESFGYERYDASILEPSELYKSKGAENEEMVNEQTYTFVDRGDREVTLRPEMTPTVARMIAARRRELSLPVRWYSIPNLFRYERPQRGRLREHWQLNCDLFGVDDVSADIEVIALAHSILKAFGAKDSDFEIRINSRSWLDSVMDENGFSEDQKKRMLLLLDRKEKIDNFEEEARVIAGKEYTFPTETPQNSDIHTVIKGLNALGVHNVTFSPSIVRGFNYYTGIVFEIFDTAKENNRALIGGGRYDNLTSLFGGEPITGIGFGMGDVGMRNFLEVHNLLPASIHITAPKLCIIPTDTSCNLEAQKLAQAFRSEGITVATDISDRKIAKKISAASDRGATYIIVVGPEEIQEGTYTLKALATKDAVRGSLEVLRKHIA